MVILRSRETPPVLKPAPSLASRGFNHLWYARPRTDGVFTTHLEATKVGGVGSSRVWLAAVKPQIDQVLVANPDPTRSAGSPENLDAPYDQAASTFATAPN